MCLLARRSLARRRVAFVPVHSPSHQQSPWPLSAQQIYLEDKTISKMKINILNIYKV